MDSNKQNRIARLQRELSVPTETRSFSVREKPVQRAKARPQFSIAKCHFDAGDPIHLEVEGGAPQAAAQSLNVVDSTDFADAFGEIPVYQPEERPQTRPQPRPQAKSSRAQSPTPPPPQQPEPYITDIEASALEDTSFDLNFEDQEPDPDADAKAFEADLKRILTGDLDAAREKLDEYENRQQAPQKPSKAQSHTPKPKNQKPASPQQSPKKDPHSIFDRMAEGMEYAATFDMGTVKVSDQLFDDFERAMEVDEITKPPVVTPESKAQSMAAMFDELEAAEKEKVQEIPDQKLSKQSSLMIYGQVIKMDNPIIDPKIINHLAPCYDEALTTYTVPRGSQVNYEGKKSSGMSLWAIATENMKEGLGRSPEPSEVWMMVNLLKRVNPQHSNHYNEGEKLLVPDLNLGYAPDEYGYSISKWKKILSNNTRTNRETIQQFMLSCLRPDYFSNKQGDHRFLSYRCPNFYELRRFMVALYENPDLDLENGGYLTDAAPGLVAQPIIAAFIGKYQDFYIEAKARVSKKQSNETSALDLDGVQKLIDECVMYQGPFGRGYDGIQSVIYSAAATASKSVMVLKKAYDHYATKPKNDPVAVDTDKDFAIEISNRLVEYSGIILRRAFKAAKAVMDRDQAMMEAIVGTAFDLLTIKADVVGGLKDIVMEVVTKPLIGWLQKQAPDDKLFDKLKQQFIVLIENSQGEFALIPEIVEDLRELKQSFGDI